MHTYLSAKIAAVPPIGAVAACPGTHILTVSDPPIAANLRTCILRHGGKRIVHLGNAEGVQVAVVRARLIKPKAVIPEYANEAATSGGVSSIY